MNISRRFFLKSSGALAVYSGISPFIPGMAQVAANGGAKEVLRGKTLVVIFLRGGMDGLNFVVPFADKAYYDIRKGIAIAQPGQENGAIDLDGFFGLNPKAASLKPLFDDGMATALQAVGYAHNTRSHFEEQDTWETGTIGNTVNSDGWLNRHLMTSKGNGPIRAISIGNSLPRILQGQAPAYAIRGLKDISLPGAESEHALLGSALEHAYMREPEQHVDPARDLLAQTGIDTLAAIEQLRTVRQTPYQTDAPYPTDRLGNQLKEVARLIKADVGLEVAEVDYGGWDTHNNQGGADGGYSNRVKILSDAVSAFTQDMGDRMNDTLVLTMSDFGRTAAENGNRGTDHGWANCMLAVGGGVQTASASHGKPVLGAWPGLEKEQLHQGRDLLHTTDFRDVLSEVVRAHLGNPHLETIMPEHTFTPVGLVS